MKKINTAGKVIGELLLDKNKTALRALISKSFYWFFLVCFNSQNENSYKIAPFQKEMIKLAEYPSIETLVITAARGLGKSTIMTQFFPLYAICGPLQKKYVLIYSQTMEQAKQNLRNIKDLIENNPILSDIFGRTVEEKIEGEWNSQSLEIPQYGAKITVTSVGRGKRGTISGFTRPDLVLGDDIEDTNSVRNKKSRDKTYRWLVKEVMPIGDKNTKFIFIGNFLHRDSALMRIKEKILSGEKKGVYREYPIIDDKGNPMWSDKYPSLLEIEAERRKIGDDVAWEMEYMLKEVPNKDKVINKDDLQYYDTLPFHEGHHWYQYPDFRFIATAIDPAITENANSDYTGMVSASVCGYGKNLKIYILPEVFNARIRFGEIREQILMTIKSRIGFKKQYIIIENNAFQLSIEQEVEDFLKKERINNLELKGYRSSIEKKLRLHSIVYAISGGTILFPKNIDKELFNQLVDYGLEGHDDLSDAFTILCSSILSMDHNKLEPRIRFLG